MAIRINNIEGEIVVDGKVLRDAQNVVIDDNGNITVNGKSTEKLSSPRTISNITINGSVGSITTKSADIKVGGNVTGSVVTTSGDINCSTIEGNVTTMSGDVTCNKIGGSVSTMSGDIIRT